MIDTAWNKGSQKRGIPEALLWATEPDGSMFKFTEDALQRDSITLSQLGMDLDALIELRQNTLKARGRLSRESLDRALTADVRALLDPEDIRRAYSLVDGIEMPTSADFTPQPHPEKLRQTYKMAMPAVHKLLHQQSVDGTVLVLPTDILLASTHLHDLHWQSLNWAAKSGQDSGRVTGDMSHTRWKTSLNGMTLAAKRDVRAQVVDNWGDIDLPSLDDIVIDILLMADAHGWANISLFKKDIAAAFHRLLFHPSCVSLTAFALDQFYTILHLVGNFGWTGLPNAWDVIGRIMLAACHPKIWATLKLYVDDFFGACLTRHLQRNNLIIDDVIRDLLGAEALAPHKDKQGRQLVILGWLFDLDTRTVTISEENLHKTLYAFLFLRKTYASGVTLKSIEAAASLATRYSVLCRPMAAFTTALYKDVAGFKGNRNAVRTLSDASVVDIHLWTAYLPLASLSAVFFARRLESFRPRPSASVNFGFDGSLGGVGLGVRTTDHTTTTADTGPLVGYAGVFPIPCLPTTNSSYQNTFELASVTASLLIAFCVGLRNFSFSTSGDSKTALSWLYKDKVSSVMGRRAAIAYAIIASAIGAHCTDTIFVRGILNTLYDALSRGVETDETRALPQHLRVDCSTGTPIYRLLALIDPQLPPLTTAQTLTFINDITQILSDIQAFGMAARP